MVDNQTLLLYIAVITQTTPTNKFLGLACAFATSVAQQCTKCDTPTQKML